MLLLILSVIIGNFVCLAFSFVVYLFVHRYFQSRHKKQLMRDFRQFFEVDQNGCTKDWEDK